MNDHEEIMQKYSFTYTDCNGKEHTKIIKTPGLKWHECLDDYVKFLEPIFGYPIKHQVRVEKPTYHDYIYAIDPDYLDPWTGEYFTKEAE